MLAVRKSVLMLMHNLERSVSMLPSNRVSLSAYRGSCIFQSRDNDLAACTGLSKALDHLQAVKALLRLKHMRSTTSCRTPGLIQGVGLFPLSSLSSSAVTQNIGCLCARRLLPSWRS